MLAYRYLLLIFLYFLLPVRATAENVSVNALLATIFTKHSVTGALIIKDFRTLPPKIYSHNTARLEQRFSPASTFKILHSLIALEEGVVRDEFQKIPWDGVKRANAAWNQDHNLRSAVRNSSVWVFEHFAEVLGLTKETMYLQKVSYGNATTTGSAPFWVESNLAISAQEQIQFLQKLYDNTLPFRVQHQLLVKDILITEAGKNWILRAKTGWSGSIAWWVGWVEWPEGPVFFVLNMDTPNRMQDLPFRELVVRQALRAIDALPSP